MLGNFRDTQQPQNSMFWKNTISELRLIESINTCNWVILEYHKCVLHLLLWISLIKFIIGSTIYVREKVCIYETLIVLNNSHATWLGQEKLLIEVYFYTFI